MRLYPFADPSSVAALHAAILSGEFTPIDRHLPQAPSTWRESFARSLDHEVSQRPGSAEAFLSACDKVLATNS